MNRQILQFGVLLAMLTMVTGCATISASGQAHPTYDFSEVERVAVVAIEGADDSEAAQNQVGMMFNQQLMAKGYAPVERAQIREVMDEQDFQQSDVTSTSGAARLGQILNVDAALIINVPRYDDEEMSMSVQMVDINDGSIVWSASGSGAIRAGLSQRAGQFFGLIGGAGLGAAAADDNTTGAILGGAAGAMGGELAGEAMTPMQQEHAADLIVEITESLPDAIYLAQP